MKKLFSKLFMVGALGGLMILSSCGGDDDDPAPPAAPQLVVTTTPAAVDGVVTLTPGQELTITVNASTPGGFNVARLTGTGTTLEVNRNDLGLAAGATSAEVDFTATFNNVGDATLTVTVVDDASQSASEDISVTVVGNPINSFTAKLLYAQLASEDSKTFFSTNLGETVSKNQVDATAAPNSSDIDFGYAAGASGSVWLASPSNYPTFTEYDLSIWTTLNTTTFVEVSLSDEAYLALDTDVELEAAFSAGTNPEDRKTGFAAGDIFAFQLDDAKGGKYGVVKVVAIVDGNDDGDIIDSTDYLEIEVLVAQ